LPSHEFRVDLGAERGNAALARVAEEFAVAEAAVEDRPSGRRNAAQFGVEGLDAHRPTCLVDKRPALVGGMAGTVLGGVRVEALRGETISHGSKSLAG
jgi:hypothetical protein